MPRRRRPGHHQPGFLGQDDGLDAVAQAELGQDPADVNFHGALGQEQAGRDLAVGHAARDPDENVVLAGGEGLAQPGAGRAARRPGAARERPDEAGGGGRGEGGVARGDGVGGGGPGGGGGGFWAGSAG